MGGQAVQGFKGGDRKTMTTMGLPFGRLLVGVDARADGC